MNNEIVTHHEPSMHNMRSQLQVWPRQATGPLAQPDVLPAAIQTYAVRWAICLLQAVTDGHWHRVKALSRFIAEIAAQKVAVEPLEPSSLPEQLPLSLEARCHLSLLLFEEANAYLAYVADGHSRRDERFQFMESAERIILAYEAAVCR